MINKSPCLSLWVLTGFKPKIICDKICVTLFRCKKQRVSQATSSGKVYCKDTHEMGLQKSGILIVELTSKGSRKIPASHQTGTLEQSDFGNWAQLRVLLNPDTSWCQVALLLSALLQADTCKRLPSRAPASVLHTCWSVSVLPASWAQWPEGVLIGLMSHYFPRGRAFTPDYFLPSTLGIIHHSPLHVRCPSFGDLTMASSCGTRMKGSECGHFNGTIYGTFGHQSERPKFKHLFPKINLGDLKCITTTTSHTAHYNQSMPRTAKY